MLVRPKLFNVDMFLFSKGHIKGQKKIVGFEGAGCTVGYLSS